MAGSKQQGAALIVVLVLMTSSLMLGLSAMQSSLVNERLAGNFRAQTLAYAEAESSIAAFYTALKGENGLPSGVTPENIASAIQDAHSKWAAVLTNCNASPQGRVAAWNALNKRIDDLNDQLFPTGGTVAGLNTSGRSRLRLAPYPNHLPAATYDEDGNCLLGQAYEDAPHILLVGDGFLGDDNPAHRTVHAVLRVDVGPGGDMPEGLMSCEGIQLAGSGMIDSYDSRLGAYGEPVNGVINAKRSNVQVATQLDGAPIRLTGQSPIYGDVSGTGALRMTGSSPIIGNVRNNGDVTMTGGDWWNSQLGDSGRIFGSVETGGSIDVHGTIHGNVKAGDTIDMNWGSQIRGDAEAEHVRFPNNSNPGSKVLGSVREVAGGPSVPVVPSKASISDCSDFGVPSYLARVGMGSSQRACVDQAGACKLNLAGSLRDIVLREKGIEDGSDEYLTASERINIDGREHSVLRLDEFRLAGSANFIVGEVGNPVDMIMVVDGDISLSGGATFRISQGSTLKIVTSGRFNLASGVTLDIADGRPTKKVGDETVPIFSVVTSHQGSGNQSGVSISGSSNFYGEVISPYSPVSISGSGDFYGSVGAREISITGAGAFHYDESFEDRPSLGEGEGGSITFSMISLGEHIGQ